MFNQKKLKLNKLKILKKSIKNLILLYKTGYIIDKCSFQMVFLKNFTFLLAKIHPIKRSEKKNENSGRIRKR